MRVHRIYLPVARGNIFELIMFSIGLLLSSVVGYVLSALPFLLFKDDSDLDPPLIAVVCMILGAVAGAAFAILAYARFRNARLFRKTAHRTQRLRELVKHPEVLDRLPHRWIEHILRQPYTTGRTLRKALEQVPPGVPIVISVPGSAGYPLTSQATSFEPVSAISSDERVQWLVQHHWMANAGASDSVSRDGDPLANDIARYGKALSRRELIGWIIPLPLTLVLWQVWHDLAFVIVVTACYVVPLLLQTLVDSSWWIVPGGVVNRRDVIGRGVPRLMLATPEESPVLVDSRDYSAIVRVGGRSKKITCNALTNSLLLASWISGAPRPTDDELESLLGGRVEHAERLRK